jgi:hypothetical protein
MRETVAPSGLSCNAPKNSGQKIGKVARANYERVGNGAIFPLPLASRYGLSLGYMADWGKEELLSWVLPLRPGDRPLIHLHRGPRAAMGRDVWLVAGRC